MEHDHLESVINGLSPAIVKALNPIVRGLYDAGFAAGYAKGVEDMNADLTQILSARASERLTAAKIDSTASAPAPLTSRAAKLVVDNRPQSDYPSYGYGVVTAAVRKIMSKANGSGIEAREIGARLMSEHQLDVSMMTVRDTLARLRGRGEVYCVKRSWFATDKLERELPLEENGPPTGKPEDGPDTALGAQ